MSRVFPGVLLVFAMRFPVSELSRVDFPTFDRPTNAISGSVSCGSFLNSCMLVTNVAEVIFIQFNYAKSMQFTGTRQNNAMLFKRFKKHKKRIIKSEYFSHCCLIFIKKVCVT